MKYIIHARYFFLFCRLKHPEKKCAHCDQWFAPNPKAAFHQRFCSRKRCQKARKRASYQRWLDQPGNSEYWRGAANVVRVQEWRKKNPFYWRRNR